MRRDLRAYLWDVQQAADDIQAFTQGKQLSDYENDTMLRAAVERRLEVIGEALAQALRHYPEIVTRISDHRQIIAFRNQLIHSYATVQDALVWDIIQTDLPILRQQAADFLRKLEDERK